MHHAGLGTENLDTEIPEFGLQMSCQVVDSGELREVVGQGVCGGRRQDTSLSHATTEELTEPASSADELC